LHPEHDLTTAELVARARAGGRDAFGELCERNSKGLYNFLLRRTRSRDDAEDLCQETFLRAWKKLGTYREDWSFSTWLYAVARSAAADRARAARVVTTDADVGAQPGREDHAHAIGTREEDENLWNTARAVLDEDQTAALWLFYAEDRSAAEIGAILGRTAISVRVMMFRARAKLGRHLERRRARSTGARAAPPRNLMDTRRMETIP
jgi:RNA polymerase sigma-70 factor (ECF subfamily)